MEDLEIIGEKTLSIEKIFEKNDLYVMNNFKHMVQMKGVNLLFHILLNLG